MSAAARGAAGLLAIAARSKRRRTLRPHDELGGELSPAEHALRRRLAARGELTPDHCLRCERVGCVCGNRWPR